jgi:WhiB family redox-sensing transcriptional regulator
MIPLALTGDSSATAWMGNAACAPADPEIFFPVPGDELGEAKAKAVCRACRARSACLSYALVHRIEHSVWGGASEDQRRAIHAGQPGGLCDE